MPLTDIVFDIDDEMNPGRGSAQSETLGSSANQLIVTTTPPANDGSLFPNASAAMSCQLSAASSGGDPGPARQWYSPNGRFPANNYTSAVLCAQDNLNPPTANAICLPNTGGCIAGAIYCAWDSAHTYGNIGIAIR